MKKFILLFLSLFLASCFGPSSEELQKAKDSLLNTGALNETASGNIEQSDMSGSQQSNTSYVKIRHLVGGTFIDVEPISDAENIKDTLDIHGIVNNLNINKIVVSFKNLTSKFPADEYDLKAYKKGSKQFLYRAYKKYQVLDSGLNTYTIDGYIGEKLVSQVEINVFLLPSSKLSTLSESGSQNHTVAFTGNVFDILPSDNASYGTPNIDTKQGTFTYSNIANFIGTKNDDIAGVTCANFADYLKQNYTWYYWNTCRPITDENNFAVNVLSLSGDQYKYERHYISAKYGIYAKLLLETGSGVMQDQLQAKNDELKVKVFPGVDTADMFMKNLLK